MDNSSYSEGHKDGDNGHSATNGSCNSGGSNSNVNMTKDAVTMTTMRLWLTQISEEHKMTTQPMLNQR